MKTSQLGHRVAIASAVTTRRRALVAVTVVLNLGLVCLALWRLAPLNGAFVGDRSQLLQSVPWVCLVALATAVSVAAWRLAHTHTALPKSLSSTAPLIRGRHGDVAEVGGTPHPQVDDGSIATVAKRPVSRATRHE